MLNAKTGLLLAVAGLLGGHYAYVHDQLFGSSVIEMGPVSWTAAGCLGGRISRFVAALARR